MNYLTKLLEAALFSANRPLALGELRALEPGTSNDAIHGALEELRQWYDEGDRGIQLVELADGYQILTRTEMAEAIAEARIANRPRRLSVAAMETLAIIAYRQPVGRAEIEEIRGVAADGVLRSLQERLLVEVAGRGEGLGRPLLYGTTSRFLEMVGLKDVDQLPRLDQLQVALRPLGGLELDEAMDAEAFDESFDEDGVPETRRSELPTERGDDTAEGGEADERVGGDRGDIRDRGDRSPEGSAAPPVHVATGDSDAEYEADQENISTG